MKIKDQMRGYFDFDKGRENISKERVQL